MNREAPPRPSSVGSGVVGLAAGLTERLDPRLHAIAVRDVASFVALEESGSFTAAAAALHVSQSTLSGRVRRLEHGLRTVLVDRSVRTLRFTPQGRRFLTEARALLQVFLDFERRARPDPRPPAS